MAARSFASLRTMGVAWPLFALLAWAACWAAFAALRAQDASPPAAATLAAVLGVAFAAFAATSWRGLRRAAGVPLACHAAGAAGPLPGWAGRATPPSSRPPEAPCAASPGSFRSPPKVASSTRAAASATP